MQVEHTYDRLAPVTIFEVDGTELSTSWRTGVTIGDNVRASIEFLVQFQLPLVLTPGCDLISACLLAVSNHIGRHDRRRFPASRHGEPSTGMQDSMSLGNDRYLRAP